MIEAVGDLLRAYRLGAEVLAQVDYCGSWSLGTAGTHKCAFHLVAEGRGWLHLREREAQPLEKGELVLFTRDVWHELSPSAAPGKPAAGGGLRITCGCFEFQDDRASPLLEALPELIVVRGGAPAERARLAELVGVLADEAEAESGVGGFVRDKLAEALFAMILRAHLESSEEKRGLLAALADARVGKALAAIHREPDRAWQVESLAGIAGMSRTAFAKSFAELAGLPPMQYVADWRIRRAAALLRDPRNSVGSVAGRLGYRSEAAFRRAFKRVQGFAPGAVRREAKP